jgi:hypothetical protein
MKENTTELSQAALKTLLAVFILQRLTAVSHSFFNSSCRNFFVLLYNWQFHFSLVVENKTAVQGEIH